MARAVALFVAFLAFTFGLVIWKAASNRAVLCEVCMVYRDARACREAYGPTADEATRTATDNACALLAAGMTASIACQNTPPQSVDCN
jgi:hypothetical protein